MDHSIGTGRSAGGSGLAEYAPAFVHATAIIENGVCLGARTSVWDNVHIRHSTRVGDDCIIGEKSHVSYSVVIGDRVKINAFVYICTAVTIEDGVMISAGTIFTNDRFPRATTPDLQALRTSAPDEHTLPTLVRAGATIGAGAIIGCGIGIGRFAMVGMGTVVTKPVPDFHLVVGNPARTMGYVCRCGEPIARFPAGEFTDAHQLICGVCSRAYSSAAGVVVELQ